MSSSGGEVTALINLLGPELKHFGGVGVWGGDTFLTAYYLTAALAET